MRKVSNSKRFNDFKKSKITQIFKRSREFEDPHESEELQGFEWCKGSTGF